MTPSSEELEKQERGGGGGGGGVCDSNLGAKKLALKSEEQGGWDG